MTAIEAPGFSDRPYWWDATPALDLSHHPLPERADAVVIGSGYAGLAAALQLARAGRRTVVLDAENAGWGCSTRNGGQVSTGLKPGYAELAARHGPERAFAMVREGQNALAYTEAFIRDERIDCAWERVGRFMGAHCARSFEALARKVTHQPKGLEVEAHVVPRAEQRQEIGTDAYFGGAVYARHAALDPARFHRGMLERARDAGATVVARCPATAIERDGRGFVVTTPRGRLAARDVLVATNGYTGPLSPYLRRRVIPIGSYIIATEPLDPALAARLIPKARVISDTRRVIFYYRLSPDRTRMLFGGRVAASEADPRRTAPLLHAEMCTLFPELATVGVTHSWGGFVAYTFDTMPHLGSRDGVWHVTGCCGSGVGLATYFGMRVGLKMLGRPEGRTALDDTPFPSRFFYRGKPWFLSAAVRWKQLMDRADMR